MILAPADQELWLLALGIALAVVVVVTVLLHRILLTAREIHRLVLAIWTGGKRIAANTVNVAQLQRTNHLAGALLSSASSIASSAARIGKATSK